MSKKEIIGKIVKELIYIDGIAVFLGGGIFFLGLYLFNHLRKSLEFFYFLISMLLPHIINTRRYPL